jgi:hypothetical protein
MFDLFRGIMNIYNLYTATVLVSCSLLSSYAFCQNELDLKSHEWDFYVNSIDPYLDSPQKKSIEQPNTHHTQHSLDKADPIAPLPFSGSTIKEISEQNQKNQKYLREIQKTEASKRYDQVKTVKQPEPSIIKSSNQFSFANSISDSNSAVSIKKVNYNWGGKLPGYVYVDYEYIFESTDIEQAKKATSAISDMAMNGWELDLNRSFQKIEQESNYTKAITTTQIRFRQRK